MCMCVLAWQRYPPTRLPLTSGLVSIMCIVPSQCCATDVAALDAGSCVLPLSLQTTIPLVKLQLFIFYLFFAVCIIWRSMDTLFVLLFSPNGIQAEHSLQL